MRTKAEIRGDAAEDYLYEFVNAHRGLSIYELSKRVGWSTGKVSNIIKKLEEDGLIRKDRLVEGGRAQTKIHPIGWKELLPDDVKETLMSEKVIL
jgi:predicted transcriptional regulator